MASSEIITLHTVPSRWTRTTSLGNCFQRDYYRRVVGLERDLETLWTPPDPRLAPSRYDRTTAVAEQHKMTGEFTNRLFSFVRTFLIEPDDANVYNCHRFAAWMIGDASAGEVRSVASPNHDPVTAQPLEAPLHLGQAAIIGLAGPHEEPRGAAFHSLIGLGEHTGDAIQVVAGMGFLAIEPTRQTLATYRAGQPGRDLRLFAR